MHISSFPSLEIKFTISIIQKESTSVFSQVGIAFILIVLYDYAMYDYFPQLNAILGM